MTFEHRNFREVPARDWSGHDEFTDLYFYKEGCTNVGIKARQPTKIKYGWKINRMEIKMQIEKEGLGQGQQIWVKQHFRCKIRLINPQCVGVELETSSDDQQQHQPLNIEGHLRVINDKICHALGKKLDENYFTRCPHILKWLYKGHPLCEVFEVTKAKQKSMGKERGCLAVQSYFRPSALLYFVTEAVEANDSDAIKKQALYMSNNVSYPQLLENISRNIPCG